MRQSFESLSEELAENKSRLDQRIQMILEAFEKINALDYEAYEKLMAILEEDEKDKVA